MTNWLKKLQFSRLRNLAHSNAVWGFADQGLISACNFAVTLILARVLGPKGFGFFILAYLALMFINSTQGTLFAQPHNVLGSVLSPRSYARYTSSTVVVLVLFAVIVVAFLLVLATVATLLGLSSTAQLLLALAPVAFFMQLQDFIRRTAYTRSKYKNAFRMSLIAYGGHVAMVMLLWRTGHLTVTLALLSMALAFGISMLAGLRDMRSQLYYRPKWADIQQAATENWRFGRWLFGGSIAYWLSSQMLPILVAGFVGSSAIAGLRAVQNFVAPTHILLRALETMVPSKASKEYQENGYDGLRRYMAGIALPGLLILFVFFVPVAIFASPITELLLGSEYEPYAWLVSIFAIVYLLEFTFSIATIVLKSLKLSSAIMFAQSISAAFVLTIGALAIWKFGLHGAAISTIAHSTLVNGILWYRILTHRTRARADSMHDLRADQASPYAGSVASPP